jgi:hypothetical protein
MMKEDLNKTCQIELHIKENILHGSTAAKKTADEKKRQ